MSGAHELVAGPWRTEAVCGKRRLLRRPDTPLKLADNYNITSVILWNSLPARSAACRRVAAGCRDSRLQAQPHEFVEVVFQNTENELQSWHLDGYEALNLEHCSKETAEHLNPEH